MVLVVRRHPEVRNCLDNRWFLQPSHPPAIIAAAGALLLLVRPRNTLAVLAALALGLPYVHHRAKMLPRKARATLILRLLVVDVAEVAVLARGSVRYRTLLL
jgi:hypothetical protein